MSLEEKIITSDDFSLKQSLSPLSMTRNLFCSKDLILQFTLREAFGRYRNTYLGLAWTLLNPLMTLGVYTIVFGYILNAKFTVMSDSGHSLYVINLFCGIIIYNIFSGCISKSPSNVVSNPNYVKKVVFPLEILPVSILFANIIQASLSFLILIPAILVFTDTFSTSFFMFPLVLIPLCALTLGISWFLSSLGVIIRDIHYLINILLHLLFFLSPIIYPGSAIPVRFITLARLNPLFTILEDARRTLIWGQHIDWPWWVSVTCFSLLVMQFGYCWFMKTKRYFSDFL